MLVVAAAVLTTVMLEPAAVVVVAVRDLDRKVMLLTEQQTLEVVGVVVVQEAVGPLDMEPLEDLELLFLDTLLPTMQRPLVQEAQLLQLMQLIGITSSLATAQSPSNHGALCKT